jgi:hypothetical protein
MALAGELIENGQHAQGAAAHGGVGDEVTGPDVAAVCRLDGQSRRVTAAEELALGRRHPQTRLPAQLLDRTLTHRPAFLPQQGRNPAVTVTGVLLREHPQPRQQLLLPWRGHRFGTVVGRTG